MAELSFKVDIDGNGFAKVKKLSNSFKDADKKAMLLGKTMQQNQQDLKRMGVGVGIVAGATALFAKKTLDSIDAQTKASRATGIQTELYTGLTHVMELGGVSQEKMNTSMKRFAKNMNDASMGIGTGVRAFEQLDIKVENSNGTLKTQEQLLLEVADKFQDMENGAQKTAIAQDIFGKSGTELINVLNGGSEAIREQLQEAEALGIVFSEDVGAGVEKAQDALTKVGTSITGFFTTILTNEDLMNRFVGVFDDLTESAKWWIDVVSEKQGDSELVKTAKQLNVELKELEELREKASGDGVFGFLMSDEDQARFDQAVKDQERVVKGYELQVASLQKVNHKIKERNELENASTEKTFSTKKVAKKEGVSAELQAKRASWILEQEEFIKHEEEKARIAQQFAEDQIQVELLLAETEREFRATTQENEIAELQAKQEKELEMAREFNLAEEEIEARHLEQMTSLKEKHTEEAIQLADAEARARHQLATDYVSAGANMTEAMSIMFKENKALARASVLMQGAVAVMNALTVQPFFLGISMAALAGAQTLDALRQVDSARAFAMGGVVSGADQFIRVNEGGQQESILNPMATKMLGREGVDFLNNGRVDKLMESVGNSQPSININVNGVLSQEVYDNEIRPMMERDAVLR